MNEEQRKDTISSLDGLIDEADELKKSLDELINGYQLWQDKSPQAANVVQAANSASMLVIALRSASDELKKLGASSVREYVNEWYRVLHWDMNARVEIAEEDIKDPEYESISYIGDDKWQVIMTTPTHGRERIIIQSDGATWWQCYSADPYLVIA